MTNQEQFKYLNIKQVMEICGLSRQTIYRKMDSGEFPLQRRLTSGRVAWRDVDINAWNNSRPEGAWHRRKRPLAKE